MVTAAGCQPVAAICAQSEASRGSSGEMHGSQAALDSPGAQYRRRKQQEQEQRGSDGSTAGSSARSSGDGSTQSGGPENGGGSAHVTAAPRQVPGSRAAAAEHPQRVMPGGGSPPAAAEHAGSSRGRGVLALAAGDGTRAMALAARFDSIVAGGRGAHHHGLSGLRPAGDSPEDITPSPSPLRTAGW